MRVYTTTVRDTSFQGPSVVQDPEPELTLRNCTWCKVQCKRVEARLGVRVSSEGRGRPVPEGLVQVLEIYFQGGRRHESTETTLCYLFVVLVDPWSDHCVRVPVVHQGISSWMMTFYCSWVDFL